MRYLDVTVLVSQIEDVFQKYDKEIPKIKTHKFTNHMVIIVGEWEFYFDCKDGGYIFNNVIDTRYNYNNDVNLNKIKGYIVCDLINNKLIS
jgi:hypothetical protein